MSERYQWRDVRVYDRVVVGGALREVTRIDGGRIWLDDGTSGLPDPRTWVEVYCPEPAEAIAFVKEQLGATVLAVQDDGKPYRCPPVAMLDGDRVKFDAHLFAFHGGAEAHEVGTETIPHTH